MFAHVWKMRARRKRAEEYEKFGRQVTLPALRKIDGCLDAYFVRVFEAHKPEYLWIVFWKDREALEAARSDPAWREQIKKFEAGKFYKTVPLELVCETVASFHFPGTEKPKKSAKIEEAEEKAETASEGSAGSAT